MLTILTVPVKLNTKLFREGKNTGCAHEHITHRAMKFCNKHLQLRDIRYGKLSLYSDYWIITYLPHSHRKLSVPLPLMLVSDAFQCILCVISIHIYVCIDNFPYNH